MPKSLHFTSTLKNFTNGIKTFCCFAKRRWANITISPRQDNIDLLRKILSKKGSIFLITNIVFNILCSVIRNLCKMRRKFCNRRNDVCSCTLNEGSLLPIEPFCAIIAETTISQCLHYRVLERVQQLNYLGLKSKFCDWRDYHKARHLLQLASCVIFYRVPMLDDVQKLLAEARRLHLPILFDIDDLIFETRHYGSHLENMDLPVSEKKGLLHLATLYYAVMTAADTLFTSTSTLSSMLPHPELHAKNIVHNSISDELVRLSETYIAQRVDDDNIIRVYYGSGTKTHDRDFSIIIDSLCDVLQKNNNIHLYLIGFISIPRELRSSPRVHCIEFLEKDTYYRTISGYDIALMPLEQTIFNDAKSNIKYQEASLFGIPSIASPCAEFVEAITDGVDGIIAETREQWRNAILQLADSPALRRKLGMNARQNVLSRYSCRHVAETELRPLLPVLPATTRQRILLVNIFFGASSFGGATMVVEDLACTLMEQEFDVHVFSTASTTSVPSGEIFRYGWNGINVIAVNTALGMEYRTSTEIKKHFNDALDSVNPSIVHFHCMQGLGIDLLDECRRRHIPYFLTMHDAWWLCPRQFMIDKSDSYCSQKIIRPEKCIERCHLESSHVYSRNFFMRDAVDSATYIFSPSDFYTNFLRCNFPQQSEKIFTNRNGIRRSAAMEKTSHAGDVLRFAFLGGKAVHKGYFFLAEALRRINRHDYTLLLVDVHSAFGAGQMDKQEINTVWPGLPVEIHPFIPHEHIDELFAKFDILLFPSLWDESFGLTVREAIDRNIFVIASDCGGPSEAIVHGKNGLVFHKGNMDEFCNHIAYVLDNKKKFIHYHTECFGDIRSVSQQAKELSEKYKQFNKIHN